MGRRSKTTCLRDVRAEPVQWLWPGRIPRGKLTMLAGDPCLGKSVITADLASRVSRGIAWPDSMEQRQECGAVLIMSAEDDPSDTIRPRIEAAGGDLGAIHLMTTGVREDGTRFPVGLGDLDVIEDACKCISNLRLVIIDPVSAFMGSTDSHNNTSVRGLLAPLSELAGEYKVTILAVSHLSKSMGGKSLYRFSGSLAFVAAARAAWLVMADPQDQGTSRRLMLPAKGNLGPQVRGMAYRVLSQEVCGLGSQPVIGWERTPVEVTADGALQQEAANSQVKGGKMVAADWLRGLLKEGRVSTAEIQEEARAAGFSWMSLRRLKDELGIRAIRVGFGGGGTWFWELPGGSGGPSIDAQNTIDAAPEKRASMEPEVSSSANGAEIEDFRDALWESIRGDEDELLSDECY